MHHPHLLYGHSHVHDQHRQLLCESQVDTDHHRTDWVGNRLFRCLGLRRGMCGELSVLITYVISCTYYFLYHCFHKCCVMCAFCRLLWYNLLMGVLYKRATSQEWYKQFLLLPDYHGYVHWKCMESNCGKFEPQYHSSWGHKWLFSQFSCITHAKFSINACNSLLSSKHTKVRGGAGVWESSKGSAGSEVPKLVLAQELKFGCRLQAKSSSSSPSSLLKENWEWAERQSFKFLMPFKVTCC